MSSWFAFHCMIVILCTLLMWFDWKLLNSFVMSIHDTLQYSHTCTLFVYALSSSRDICYCYVTYVNCMFVCLFIIINHNLLVYKWSMCCVFVEYCFVLNVLCIWSLTTMDCVIFVRARTSQQAKVSCAQRQSWKTIAVSSYIPTQRKCLVLLTLFRIKNISVKLLVN